MGIFKAGGGGGGAGGGGLTRTRTRLTTSGTWTKPAGLVRFEVLIQAGGTGGYSGDRRASGVQSLGGRGGDAGMRVYVTVDNPDLLPSSIAYTIGAGGAGGAANTVDTSAGTGGGGGSATTFGLWIAPATQGTPQRFLALAGDSSILHGYTKINAVNPIAGTLTRAMASVGAGGGSLSAADVFGAGNGITVQAMGSSSATIVAGGVSVGTAGTDATEAAAQGWGMAGGGGGASGDASTPGGAGGNGILGSGGGGGGGSRNGQNSGAGGNGGNGYIEIIEWVEV